MRRSKNLPLAMAVLLCALAWGGALRALTFTGPELLGRPTATSVTVSVAADSPLEAYFEYGTSSGSYAAQTPAATYSAGVPIVAALQNLQPDAIYYYRMRYRAPGSGAFDARPEHSFHTQRASHEAFTFTVQADSHIYDKKGNLTLYAIAEQNQLADGPDFMLDLGDTFGDDHQPYSMTYADEDQLHLDQRPLMGNLSPSVPVFLALGNHEGEAGFYLSLTPPDNLCIYATKARQKYFPNPVPDGFYTGNASSEGYGVGLPQNYYSWQWGDALFVVLDAYRYNTTDPKESNDMWDWTLGKAQYDWFRATLEGSHARYKFVFIHHVLGQTRGGVGPASGYEWGGQDKDGSYAFDARRPGWGKPIQQVMADAGVTIFFQGHDHLYAKEELGGVVYQEVPMPSDATYHVGDVNADAYTGVVLNNTGHLRVAVSPPEVKVDYVRAYLPGDGTNGEVAASYTVQNPAPWAAFAVSPSSPKVGEPAAFADRSGNGPTSWSWTFGDGGASTLQNPSHTYAAAGTYTVTLTASNAHGSDAATREVAVSSSCAISGVVKAASPFRLKVSGSGFQQGCTVTVDGVQAPTTAYASAASVTAKGGASLKAMVPSGVPVQVVVVNPDGSRSAPFPYTR